MPKFGGIIIIIGTVINLALSCVVNKQNSGNTITRIMVSYISPDRVINNKGESFIYDFYISYYRQYRLYELPYHKTLEIDNRLIYDSTKFDFFIYNTTNKFGYLLKGPTDSFKVKMSSDSILKLRALGGTWDIADFFKEVKNKSLCKLTDINESEVYRYIFENEFYDSAYFYYKKDLKNIEFSISKTLDSSYDSKLYRVQHFIKHNGASITPALKDFYINSIEFDKKPAANENEIKALFERFIKEEKENHFK
jgi:hypothetical protein